MIRNPQGISKELRSFKPPLRNQGSFNLLINLTFYFLKMSLLFFDNVNKEVKGTLVPQRRFKGT